MGVFTAATRRSGVAGTSGRKAKLHQTASHILPLTGGGVRRSGSSPSGCYSSRLSACCAAASPPACPPDPTGPGGGAERWRCFQASAGPLAPPLTELTDANPAADRLGWTRGPAGEQRRAAEPGKPGFHTRSALSWISARVVQGAWGGGCCIMT